MPSGIDHDPALSRSVSHEILAITARIVAVVFFSAGCKRDGNAVGDVLWGRRPEPRPYAGPFGPLEATGTSAPETTNTASSPRKRPETTR